MSDSEPTTFVHVRADAVKPYRYGIWCSVGNGPPFVNPIVTVSWSEDGAEVWFGLESHNFDSYPPDELVKLVPLGEFWANYPDRPCAAELKRPVQTVPCGSGRAGLAVKVTVEIPMILPSAGNLHEHWRRRHQRIKAQRSATRLTLSAGSVYPRVAIRPMEIGPMSVTLTRVSPRALDSDNLAFAFKGVRDEIAAYFGLGDADPRLEWVYAQAKGKAAVRIEFSAEAP